MKKGIAEKPVSKAPDLRSLIHYIASGNPNGVRQLAYSHGYPGYTTYQGSIRFLHQFLKNEGEKGFEDLIMQHPDKEVILEVHYSRNPQRIEINSFTGSDPKPETQDNLQSLYNKLGSLIAQRRERVVNLLSKYGEQVKDKENLHEISAKLITTLQRGDEKFQHDLAAEIADIEEVENAHFVPVIGAVVNGIGKLASKLSGKNKEENTSALTLAALNQHLNNTTQPPPKPEKDNTQLIVGLGIAGSIILLVIFILLIIR